MHTHIKKLLRIIFCLSLGFSTFAIANNPTTDWKRLGLNGRIKRLTETKKVYRGTGDSSIMEKSVTISHFDIRGNLTNIVDYDSLNHIIGKIGFLYDKKGNKILETEYDATGKVAARTKYSYDNENRLIRSTSWKRQENQYENAERSFLYVYTVCGDSDIIYQYNEFKELLSKSIRLKSSNEEVVFKYNTDDSFFTKNVFRYNSDNKIIEADFYDAKGELTNKTVNGYDSIPPGFLLQKESFQRIDSVLKPVSIIYYGYDYGRLMETGETDLVTGVRQVCYYTFLSDLKDNWNGLLIFKDDQLQVEIERDIRFY